MRRVGHRGIGGLWVVGLVCAAALPAAAAPAGGGFRALRGAAAQAFTLPADMALARRETLATRGLVAERYRQYLGQAEVLGGQLTIYRDAASGAAVAVAGAHHAGLVAQNKVTLTPAAAQAIAAARPEAVSGGTWVTDLMIDPANGRYFYRADSRGDTARWFFWVDAETGVIVNAYDGLTTGSGVGVDGAVKDLTDLTTFSGGKYQAVSANGRIHTYDAINRNRLPGTLATDGDDNWNTPGQTSPGQPALVDAHFGANVTDRYFQTEQGFDWLAHYAQGMVSSAHLQRNYNNAYWNGTQMAYGDGDGTTFREFSGDLDVVGHELSHGVTEATSNLVYQNESGALNEAFSDIFGTTIEFFAGTGNWTIGEDITIGSNGIRNMANPGEDGDPSHYADRYTGTGDNGGVHTNSGIANHWYYLLVNGGQNAKPSRASGTPVQGIGLAAAAQVAFLGFTALPATANFCAARASTIAVAGAYDAQVADAWDEVGVDSTLCVGSGGGGSGGAGPVISNVSSRTVNKRGTFVIDWTTDLASDSTVTFTCCGTYSNTSLVTAHSMSFNGTRGTLYEYYVGSAANGVSSSAGPFYHQN